MGMIFALVSILFISHACPHPVSAHNKPGSTRPLRRVETLETLISAEVSSAFKEISCPREQMKQNRLLLMEYDMPFVDPMAEVSLLFRLEAIETLREVYDWPDLALDYFLAQKRIQKQEIEAYKQLAKAELNMN